MTGDAPVPSIDQAITFLSVSDLEAADRFYSGLLGMPMVLDQGSCRIFRLCGEAFLGVCERPAEVSSAGVVVTIVTDEVDAWHDRLTAHGVAVHKAPAENPEYRIYNGFYRDPDGYLVEIQQFLDPGWPAPGN
jgi:catechol 2,3-dioxygenase-like lactoylglutathione lyase family enzyme